MSEKYYLQDSRSYVGNDVLWWAKNGKGYTTDLIKAEVYTKEEAIKLHNSRESDIPWPKDYIDSRTRPAVDFQYINIKKALRNTGIKLNERPVKKDTYQCHGCSRYMHERDYFSNPCDNCGCDNRP